jgi:hypothetical protein
MTITLTFQGIGSGSVTPTGATKPVLFSNSEFVFSFTTDTTQISQSGAVFNTPFVTGGIVQIGGKSGTFSVPVSAQVNSPWVNFSVRLSASSSDAVVGGASASFAGYNLQSAIGPLALSSPDVNVDPRSIPTSFGSFILTGVSSETFTIAGEYYFIKSKLNGDVIDILGASTAPGAGLDSYPQKTTGTDNQLWEFVSDPGGSGYYFIKSKLDGSVIDIEGASTKAGALLDAYPQKTTGTGNQLWEFVSDPAGSGYCFIKSQLNGNVIDIQGASTNPATPLDAYPWKLTGYDNQLWTVVGGSFPSVVGTVPQRSGGDSGYFNYIQANGSSCATLTGVKVTIYFTQDLVWESSSPPSHPGLSIQLNAETNSNQPLDWLQFIVHMGDDQGLWPWINIWKPAAAGESGDPAPLWIQSVANPLVNLPQAARIPAGYSIIISLQNDSENRVTGAIWQALDNTGKSIGLVSYALSTSAGGGVPPADLCPIASFQVTFGGALDGAYATFSSGAGVVIMEADQAMNVDASWPSCIGYTGGTGESSNIGYGPLESRPSKMFSQAFGVVPDTGQARQKNLKGRKLPIRPNR